MRILLALSCALLLVGVAMADQLVWGVPEAQVIQDNSVLIADLPIPADAGTVEAQVKFPDPNNPVSETVDAPQRVMRVSDGLTPVDCTHGEGTFVVVCYDTGSEWRPARPYIQATCYSDSAGLTRTGSQCCALQRLACDSVTFPSETADGQNLLSKSCSHENPVGYRFEVICK